jgi:Glycosyl transferase family 11
VTERKKLEAVIANLIGGLGNQLFQYAAGRAIAHRLGVPLLLDVSGFAQYELRRYELGDLCIRGRVATEDELAHSGISTKSPTLLRRFSKALGLARPANLFKEGSFAYDARFEQVVSPVYLSGYWQSERYFLEIADLLRTELSLNQPVNAVNEQIAAQIRDAGASAVSLHIRRGDYVNNPQTAQYHGVCSLDYYRAAVDCIAERVPDPHFFVFSDDHAWVSDNFKLDQSMTMVDVNDADRGVWDMALMRGCRHHVIANSSFSWWGAWLNNSKGKVVIAPKRWFNDSTIDTKDLIPSAWVRL